MKAEYKVARSSGAQQWAHKNSVCREGSVRMRPPLCSGLSLLNRAMTGHQTGVWIDTLSVKSSGKYARKSEKVTVFLSTLSHLSPKTAAEKSVSMWQWL